MSTPCTLIIIIISVHGVDIHYLDPLTHMHCTLDALYQIPYIIKSLADTYTNGKVIMFGGGGYNIWKVVPRAWTHVFLALLGESPLTGNLPEAWIKKWQHYAPITLPNTWQDECEDFQVIPDYLLPMKIRGYFLCANWID